MELPVKNDDFVLKTDNLFAIRGKLRVLRMPLSPEEVLRISIELAVFSIENLAEKAAISISLVDSRGIFVEKWKHNVDLDQGGIERAAEFYAERG